MTMHRAQRSLWILTASTVFAAGLVSQALAARPGVGTDLLLGASLVILSVSAALLVRVTRYLTRSPAKAAVRNAPGARSPRPLP